MSFSATAKNELARIFDDDECCRRSELSALVKMCGSIQISEGQLSLQVATAKPEVARKVFTLFKNLFSITAQIVIRCKDRPRKRNSYLVRLPPKQDIKQILATLGVDGYLAWFDKTANKVTVRKDCCSRSYLRGCFLGGGFITNPRFSYHLEILETSAGHARTIADLMQGFELNAKVGWRKKRYVVYLKDSDHIASFFSLIGAHGALLEYENIRVYKDVRNTVNRLVNCETANINKTAIAAVRQLENIELVISTLGLTGLPATLRELIDLRVRYPDISLKELGDLMNPPVSKSGVNHRMRKLEGMAEDIRIGMIQGKNRGNNNEH